MRRLGTSPAVDYLHAAVKSPTRTQPSIETNTRTARPAHCSPQPAVLGLPLFFTYVARAKTPELP